MVNQRKCTQDLITLAVLIDNKHVDTPLEINVKYSKYQGEDFPIPTLYRRLVGSLIYLIITRLDISYSVQVVSQFIAAPKMIYLTVAHRIIRYFRGTKLKGVIFFLSSSSPQLHAFPDGDWTGCPNTCRSTIGWCIFLDNSLILWNVRNNRT